MKMLIIAAALAVLACGCTSSGCGSCGYCGPCGRASHQAQ